MKNKSLLLAIVSLVLIPLSVSAWDTRLLGLGSPSLAIGEGVPQALFTSIGPLPTDQYNVGISVIADPVDIFTLPQQLGNEKLFPSNALIAEWTGVVGTVGLGNGGLVMKPKGPMTFAIFLLRPGNNGFVTGGPRGAFTGLGTSFAADVPGVAVTTPFAPANIFDLFFSYKLGNILLGGSAGFSYTLTTNTSTNTVGTPNTNVDNNSSSWAATGRLGASMPLGPAGLDAGVVVVVGSETATRVTGSAAGSLNNKLTATNVALAVNVRGSLPLADTLNLAAVGNFSMLPQNYSASTAAGAVNNTTNLIDPSGLWSAGTGAGVTWKASDAFVITGYLSGIVGAGDWVGTIGVAKNSTLWVTVRPLLNGELKPASWLTLRGGVSYSGTYNTTTLNAATAGTQSTATTWTNGVSANAGASVQLTDKAILEMVINLANFTGNVAIATPFLQTSLKMDL
jgi:hypothetical protein